MRLSDRFAEINEWTTARKAAVLGGAITAPVMVANLVVGHLLLRGLGWVDMVWYDLLFGIGSVMAAGAGAVAWLVARTGAEGRWTWYLLGVPFGAFACLLAYAMGANSTALLVVMPMASVLGIIWYDHRIGRFLIWYLVLSLLLLDVVTATGVLPYAPAVHHSDIAREGGARFTIAIAYLVLMLCLVVTVSALLMVSSARATRVRLDHANDQLSRANAVIARYVPTSLAEDILAGRTGDADGYERRKLTIFFSDIVGFTDIAEELEAEDLALVLNEYFSEMTAIADRHHGTVDELQGDALLILFGAPNRTSDRDHALDAVRMATEMQAALDRLNARWREAGITESLAVRMGINTGVVTIGHFGSPQRMKYAALGRHVNIAARLQAICRPGRTVISYATWLLVNDQVASFPLGPQNLKGVSRPTEAYELGECCAAPTLHVRSHR